MYMKNTKSINIYMGIIGEAYVDKETAYGVLLAAKKNILDVQAIIKFGEDLSRPLSQAASQASDAIDKAVFVYNKLKDAINEQSKDGIIYKKLIALLADLNENDFDNDFSNGGNIYTARENLAFAESLEAQRLEILAKANELLEANRLNAVVRCKEFNIAREIFESMIPDASISPEDLSDTLEDEYMRALNHIQSNISYISSSSTTISAVSDNVSDKIDKILDGSDENQQIINDVNYGYWYAGNIIPTDPELTIALGFTVVDDNNLENKYQDENGDWHYSDFGVDGPLKANHWFHLPKDLARDGQLIAGVDGGKVSKKNWFIAVPTTVKNYKGEDEQLYPCVPLSSVIHTDGSHRHDVKIYSDENNLGYTREGNMTINEVEYVIWKLDSTEFNAQRLNVYMNVGTENAEEATDSISNYLYLYVGSEKPTSDSMPYEGKESDNNINDNWHRIEESPASFNITADKKIFYVAIPNELTIVSNGENMLANEETSPFTLVYENLIIAGHQYDVYITGNDDAAFNYDIIAKSDYNPEIPDEPTPEEPEDNTVHVTNVEITNAPVYMFSGDTYELQANVLPENATNKNINWSSSDNSIITVDNNGLITAISEGTVRITVTSEDNNITNFVTIGITSTINYDNSKKYWYIGETIPTEINNIYSNNNIIGWHELNNNELRFNNSNLIEFNSPIQYYLVIPNDFNIYAADGSTIMEGRTFNSVECNIDGYKAFQYKSAVWDVKGIIIKQIQNEEHEEQDQNYYWYVGSENSSIISDIQNDNTFAGWHEIGSSLSNFNLTFNNQQMIEFNDPIQYYVIIPSSLHIYAADGNTIMEGQTLNSIDCNLSGYKAFQYRSAVYEVKGIIIK